MAFKNVEITYRSGNKETYSTYDGAKIKAITRDIGKPNSNVVNYRGLTIFSWKGKKK